MRHSVNYGNAFADSAFHCLWKNPVKRLAFIFTPSPHMNVAIITKKTTTVLIPITPIKVTEIGAYAL